jgi:hypothetical protein
MRMFGEVTTLWLMKTILCPVVKLGYKKRLYRVQSSMQKERKQKTSTETEQETHKTEDPKQSVRQGPTTPKPPEQEQTKKEKITPLEKERKKNTKP